jgi:hypothetical protein
MPSAVCSPVVYLPVQATCVLIIATASASVSADAAGALRVASTNNSQNRVGGNGNVARHLLPEGIADLIASCGFEAENLPAPHKLVLSRRLLGVRRHRGGNQYKGAAASSTLFMAISLAYGAPLYLPRIIRRWPTCVPKRAETCLPFKGPRRRWFIDSEVPAGGTFALPLISGDLGTSGHGSSLITLPQPRMLRKGPHVWVASPKRSARGQKSPADGNAAEGLFRFALLLIPRMQQFLLEFTDRVMRMRVAQDAIDIAARRASPPTARDRAPR